MSDFPRCVYQCIHNLECVTIAMARGTKFAIRFVGVSDSASTSTFSHVLLKLWASGKVLSFLSISDSYSVLIRCEALMRAAERELLEIERKRQSTSTSSGEGALSGSLGSAPPKSASEAMNQKFLEITKKINEETKRLAAVRAQLQKAKSNSVTVTSEKKKESAKDKAEKDSAAVKGEDYSFDKNVANDEKKKILGVRGQVNVVPDTLLPFLCK